MARLGMRSGGVSTSLVVVVLTQFGWCSISSADETDDNPAGLEVVTVTANKRLENLQEVPTSVSALNAGALKDLGVTSTMGIAQFVAGVQVVSENSGSDNYFSIRGATQNEIGRAHV